MFTFQALQLLLFLIPGFIVLLILNSLVNRKPQRSDFSQITEALVYSMIIYAIYSAIGQNSTVSLNQTPETISYSFDPKAFFTLIVLSAIVPLIFGYSINRNFHTKLLNRLGISPKSARLSVWDDAFYDYRRFVVIDFEDGRRLYGWPRYYSAGTDEPYLFIYKPFWIVCSENNGSDYQFQETGLDGLLITPHYKIHSIGFMPQEFQESEQRQVKETSKE